MQRHPFAERSVAKDIAESGEVFSDRREIPVAPKRINEPELS
ncbi:hypothetical protein FIC_01596 [Flavobacteriaceae bacterium 3519-10]|nr:hypothetical protein FIC_01596 [Flavobacteriaceae bacterium 3519-10]